MRDLSKSKTTGSIRDNSGNLLLEIRKGKRGGIYICFVIKYPGPIPTYGYRDFRDMRLSQLKDAAVMIGDLLTREQLRQEAGEKILDLIYHELNRRLNKV